MFEINIKALLSQFFGCYTLASSMYNEISSSFSFIFFSLKIQFSSPTISIGLKNSYSFWNLKFDSHLFFIIIEVLNMKRTSNISIVIRTF